MKIRSLIVTAACLISLPSAVLATPTPNLYPNQHLNEVGATAARRDVIDCQIKAEDYLAQNSKSNSGAKKVLRGGAKGAALGALGGAIAGNAGRGAGAGAAIGGTASLLNSAKESREGSPEYRQYVEACLDDLGYKVVGWK